MNLYCIKCSMFTKNIHVKIKHERNGKINLYSLKKFETIDKEELKFTIYYYYYYYYIGTKRGRNDWGK